MLKLKSCCDYLLNNSIKQKIKYIENILKII